MIKTKYTIGFEKFWKVWRGVTGKATDKPEAFKYWKRDRLEGDEDELIRILNLQQTERERFKTRGEWIPEWCFCRKWLNKRRYEYVPELPKKRQEAIRPLTDEESKRIAEMSSPESMKARAEYCRLRDEIWGENGKKIITTMSPQEFNNRRNKALKKLNKCAEQGQGEI